MPRATLKDVADKAEVSRTTASLILNGRAVRVSEETRRKVLKAARELQYAPNALIRSLQTQRTGTIGIYIGAGEDFLNLYIGSLFNSIRKAAEKQGYDVLVYRIGDSGKPLDVSLFLDGRVDGVIYWGGMREISYADLARAGLPVVVLLDQPKDAAIPSLTFDDEEGMKLALRHLTELGHHNIAYIPGRNVPHLRNRLDAFRQAASLFEELRLDVQVWSQTALEQIPLKSRLSEKEGRPTAVICAFDALAAQCLAAAQQAGLHVPEDLSIVSWEDLQLPGAGRFTGVEHRIGLLGSGSVNYLVELIQDEPEDGMNRVLPVALHIRDTTGPAPDERGFSR